MTREHWAEMTPEKQRIKVAELCGYINIQETPMCGFMGLYGDHIERRRLEYPIPDYLNDLNAMHEAEKLIASDVHKLAWCRVLAVIIHEQHVAVKSDAQWMRSEAMMMATAAQRAEAFVLTMTAEDATP